MVKEEKNAEKVKRTRGTEKRRKEFRTALVLVCSHRRGKRTAGKQKDSMFLFVSTSREQAGRVVKEERKKKQRR